MLLIGDGHGLLPGCGGDGSDDGGAIEAGLGELFLSRALVDPLAWDAHARDGACVEAEFMAGIDDAGAEATFETMVFDGDDRDVSFDECAEECGIDGFGEPSVVEVDVEIIDGVDGVGGIDDHGAVAEDCDIGVFVCDEWSRDAEFEWRAVVGESIGDVIARVADDAESGVVVAHEFERGVEAGFVHGGGECGIGEDAHDADIAEAVVDGAIAADESGAVEAESDGESLECDFLEGLVEGALDECGVDGVEGFPAGLGESGHHVHGV